MEDNNQSNQIQPISKFQLKLNYWYLNNKARLKIALVVFLIAFSVGLFSYSIYQAATIVFIDDRNLNAGLTELTQNNVTYVNYHRVNAPKNIEITEFTATATSEGKYDFLARVYNPNTEFAATDITFQLLAGNQIVAEKSTFILPGQEKFFAFFNQEVPAAGSPGLNVKAVSWARQRSWDSFGPSRLDFQISDKQFTPAVRSGVAGAAPVGVLNFKIKNATAYSYWQVGLYIALYSGDRVVGSNFVAMENFNSGEQREMSIKFTENFPSISKIEIIPEVNILDPTIYK